MAPDGAVPAGTKERHSAAAQSTVCRALWICGCHVHRVLYIRVAARLPGDRAQAEKLEGSTSNKDMESHNRQ